MSNDKISLTPLLEEVARITHENFPDMSLGDFGDKAKMAFKDTKPRKNREVSSEPKAKREPSEYNQFVAERASEGKKFSEIGEEWQKKKSSRNEGN